MHDNDAPVSSPEQDAWKEMAAAIRVQLEKRIPDLAAMNPDEISDFMEAVSSAQELELYAPSYDARQLKYLSQQRDHWA